MPPVAFSMESATSIEEHRGAKIVPRDYDRQRIASKLALATWDRVTILNQTQPTARDRRLEAGGWRLEKKKRLFVQEPIFYFQSQASTPSLKSQVVDRHCSELMAVRSQLIEILAKHAPLSAADMDHALQVQQREGLSLAEALIRESLLDEDDLFFLLSRRLRVPTFPEERLLHLTLPVELRRLVPRSFARTCTLVPLDLDQAKGCLSVVMLDPSDQDTLDRLRKISQVPTIRTYLARRSAIVSAVQAVYTDEVAFSEKELKDTLPYDARSAKPAPEKMGVGQEPKVELDPSLAREIAALSAQAELVRLKKGEGQAPRKAKPEKRSKPTAARSRKKVPFAESVTDIYELKGRSLLRDDDDEELTNPLGVAEPIRQRVEEEKEGQGQGRSRSVTPTPPIYGMGEVTPKMTALDHGATPLPDIRHMEELDSLLKELLSSVGILVAMLEERIDPMGESYREFGRITRLVAREMGMDEMAVSRVALAAHLYSLDIALRREVGVASSPDVRVAFTTLPSFPGGIGPSLRMLGAKVLGITEGDSEDPLAVKLIRLVANYLDLRSEAGESAHDVETLAQLLRAGGADPLLIAGLVRVVETSNTARVRIESGPLD